MENGWRKEATQRTTRNTQHTPHTTLAHTKPHPQPHPHNHTHTHKFTHACTHTRTHFVLALQGIDPAATVSESLYPKRPSSCRKKKYFRIHITSAIKKYFQNFFTFNYSEDTETNQYNTVILYLGIKPGVGNCKCIVGKGAHMLHAQIVVSLALLQKYIILCVFRIGYTCVRTCMHAYNLKCIFRQARVDRFITHFIKQRPEIVMSLETKHESS